MTEISQIIEAIREANPTRNASNLNRRIIKIVEELGEVSEAYLNVTSATNGKGMTWNDVHEERADALIVAVDVALTVFAGEKTQSVENTFERICVVADTELDPDPQFERHFGQLLNGVAEMMRWQSTGEQYVIYLREASMGAVAAAFKLAMTELPNETDLTRETKTHLLFREVQRKLAKWQNNRDTGKVATDAE